MNIAYIDVASRLVNAGLDINTLTDVATYWSGFSSDTRRRKFNISSHTRKHGLDKRELKRILTEMEKFGLGKLNLNTRHGKNYWQWTKGVYIGSFGKALVKTLPVPWAAPSATTTALNAMRHVESTKPGSIQALLATTDTKNVQYGDGVKNIASLAPTTATRTVRAATVTSDGAIFKRLRAAKIDKHDTEDLAKAKQEWNDAIVMVREARRKSGMQLASQRYRAKELRERATLLKKQYGI